MPRKSKNKTRQNQELRRQLARLRETGLYSPKSDELTDYRKRRIRAAMRTHAEDLDKSKSLFVKLPKGETHRARTVKQRAGKMGMTATGKGLFVRKEGFQEARLKYDYKAKKFDIVKTRKVRRGREAGTVSKASIPLLPIDSLARDKARLKREAKKFGKMGEGEYLAFKVRHEGQEGFSHKVFKNVDQLMKYLSEYKKSGAGRQIFYSYIEIEKTTVSKWFKEHPASARRKKRKRKVNRTGRN